MYTWRHGKDLIWRGAAWCCASCARISFAASSGQRRALIALLLSVLLSVPDLAVAVSLPAWQEDPQSLLREAVDAQRAGRYDEAIRMYGLLLEKYPDVATVRSNLGAALASAGRYEEAIVEYRRALLQKAIPEVQLNLAIAYYKTAQLSLAVEAFEKTRALMPGDPRPVLLLADCDLRLGENKKVVELLMPLEGSQSEDLSVTYLLGTALIRDNQVVEGQKRIERILKNGDSAEARLLIGTSKMMVSDYSGALVDLQKAVELNPELPDVFAYYGTVLMATGDQDGARKAFERALRQDPNNFQPNLQLGYLLRNNQEYEEALKYFRHALELRPRDPGVRYQIASIELARGNIAEAQAGLESLIKEAPEFTEAHVSLATVYYRLKRKVDGDRERQIVDRLTAKKQTTDAASLKNQGAPPRQDKNEP